MSFKKLCFNLIFYIGSKELHHHSFMLTQLFTRSMLLIGKEYIKGRIVDFPNIRFRQFEEFIGEIKIIYTYPRELISVGNDNA
jgi:hypothetical protein